MQRNNAAGKRPHCGGSLAPDLIDSSYPVLVFLSIVDCQAKKQPCARSEHTLSLLANVLDRN